MFEKQRIRILKNNNKPFGFFRIEKKAVGRNGSGLSIYHILFIIIMETKSAKIIPTTSTRSSRRVKGRGCASGLVGVECEGKIEMESSENNNNICMNNDE